MLQVLSTISISYKENAIRFEQYHLKAQESHSGMKRMHTNWGYRLRGFLLNLEASCQNCKMDAIIIKLIRKNDEYNQTEDFTQ